MKHFFNSVFTVSLIFFGFSPATLAKESASTVEAKTTSSPKVKLESARSKCPTFSKVEVSSNGSADFRECQVNEFGKIDSIDGHDYYYALYCMIPHFEGKALTCQSNERIAEYYKSRAMAVFEAVSDNELQLVFEKVDTEHLIYFSKPSYLDIGREKVLYLPIWLDGTGAGNASEYYSRSNKAWQKIDSESWKKSLNDKIPKDLAIMKGIWIDLAKMTATINLYKDSDANCCPSGGEAFVELGLEQNKFVLKKLTLRPLVPAK